MRTTARRSRRCSTRRDPHRGRPEPPPERPRPPPPACHALAWASSPGARPSPSACQCRTCAAPAGPPVAWTAGRRTCGPTRARRWTAQRPGRRRPPRRPQSAGCVLRHTAALHGRPRATGPPKKNASTRAPARTHRWSGDHPCPLTRPSPYKPGRVTPQRRDRLEAERGSPVPGAPGTRAPRPSAGAGINVDQRPAPARLTASRSAGSGRCPRQAQVIAPARGEARLRAPLGPLGPRGTSASAAMSVALLG